MKENKYLNHEISYATKRLKQYNIPWKNKEK